MTYARFAADGTWGTAFEVPAFLPGDQSYESSAALPGGGWVVAWQDGSAGDGTAAVDSTYTDANRLDTLGMTVSSTLGPNMAFSYDSAGELSGLTRREGTSGATIDSTYAYDPAGRLTDIAHASSATGALSTFAYGYDAANRLTTYTGPEGSRAYGYDNTDQLTSVTDTGSSTVLESYTYDANGNRTMSGYTTGTGNQLTSDGTFTYTYDTEGNVITKVGAGQDWQYTYDFRNRLVEAMDTSSGYDAQYTYDVFDRRIGVNENGTQTWTRYDGANAWADFDGSGTLTMRYLNGPGMDERYARVNAGGIVGWYLTDNLGSVRQVAHTNGTVLDNINYGAFGNIVSESDASSGDRFKFTGREWDAGTGQYYYRARYYGAGVGRFSSQDPTGFAAEDADLYRSVGNNSISLNDPTGEHPGDKRFGKSDEFWKWWDKQGKYGRDPINDMEGADEAERDWKDLGKPDADGHTGWNKWGRGRGAPKFNFRIVEIGECAAIGTIAGAALGASVGGAGGAVVGIAGGPPGIAVGGGVGTVGGAIIGGAIGGAIGIYVGIQLLW